MKRALLLFLALGGLLSTTLACDIEVRVDARFKKELYKTGDEIVVIVAVTKSHRVCRVDIEETTFTSDGMTILSATDWKQIAPNVWERKMKLKVVSTPTGKLAFQAQRKCSKEDSAGSITLQALPLTSS